MKRAVAVVTMAAALLAAPPAALAAEPVTLGTGELPSVSVDPAGTAFIAWAGFNDGGNYPVFACRLPRGALACEGGVVTVTTSGIGNGRPFITVSGSRVVVVQHRGVGSPQAQLYRYLSDDRGSTFGPGEAVGKLAFNDAVVGPGDTLSGVTELSACGMCFQNVALDGPGSVDLDGNSTVPHAVLSDKSSNTGVGLLDAGTPMVVFSDNEKQYFRKYGSGTSNAAASWSAPVELSMLLSYPRLAGGPLGMFILGASNRTVHVAKFDGQTLATPVTIGDTFGVQHHLFQDAGGRLHAVWERFGATGVEFRHGVSDDGTTWRSGVAATQAGATEFGNPRIATAADHVGVAVWQAGREIRAGALGPNAPVDPILTPPAVTPQPTAAPSPTAAVKRTPTLSATGSAKRSGRKFRIKLAGKLGLPADVSRADGCQGTVKLTVRRKKKAIAGKTVAVDAKCRFAFSATVKRRKVKRAKRLALRVSFSGNAVLTTLKRDGSVPVKR